MAWSWYSVKTLYRLEAKGQPDETDKDYDPEATLVEERIVLFKARSFDEVIIKAEREAKAYADETEFKNLYGERVPMK